MKRLLRILLFFTLILALLAFIGGALFRILLPPAKLRRLAENGARGYLQRIVTIGSVSVGPFSGVTLLNVAVPVESNLMTRNIVYFDELILKPRSLARPLDFDAFFTARHAAHRFSGNAHIVVDHDSHTVTLDKALLREGQAGLTASGYARNLRDLNNVSFSVDLEGDKAVFEAVAGIFADLSGVQFFPEQVVRLNISGTPGALKIRFLKAGDGKKTQKKVQ